MEQQPDSKTSKNIDTPIKHVFYIFLCAYIYIELDCRQYTDNKKDGIKTLKKLIIIMFMRLSSKLDGEKKIHSSSDFTFKNNSIGIAVQTNMQRDVGCLMSSDSTGKCFAKKYKQYEIISAFKNNFRRKRTDNYLT